MIGVDTNVLVRLFVSDAPAQTRAAAAFLAARTPEDPAFVSAVVVVELAWVLKRVYGFTQGAVIKAIDSLFESENVVVERSGLLEAAVATAREQRADIADCIIAALALEAGAGTTVTFDKPAANRVPCMEALS